jgi:hypothetical protein
VKHVEEKDFAFRLELRRGFTEDYDGDEDGYAWRADVTPMVSEMLAQLVATAARHGWKIRPANRGRSSEDEITLVVEKDD